MGPVEVLAERVGPPPPRHYNCRCVGQVHDEEIWIIDDVAASVAEFRKTFPGIDKYVHSVD
jgi:hypothetical protein